MPLSPDQLQIASFETTSPEISSSTLPYTQEKGCYSPLCMPTALPEQCPEQTVVTTA